MNEPDQDTFSRSPVLSCLSSFSFFQYRSLPSSIRDRIRHYYQYMWSTFRGVDEKIFFADLPFNLKAQMAGAMTLAAIRKIPLFNRFCEACLLEIATIDGSIGILSQRLYLAKRTAHCWYE